MGECRTCQHWSVGRENSSVGTCSKIGAFQYGQKLTLTYGGYPRSYGESNSDFEAVRTKFNFGCIGYSEIMKTKTIEDIIASDSFKEEIEDATLKLQAVLPEIVISATPWTLGEERVVRVDIIMAGRTLEVIFTLDDLLSNKVTSRRITAEFSDAFYEWLRSAR